MTKKWFDPFWVSVTVVITVILLIVLLPHMLDSLGVAGTIFGALLLLVGMGLAYVRGYWVSRWIEERRERKRSSGTRHS